MAASIKHGRDTAGSTEAERLRAVGLRVTAPRLAVLGWLAEHPHTTADEVAGGVREQLGTVSTQAIYDVLHACARARLVRRIEPAGHPARFETRTGDNHHHVVCRCCGRAEDVDCATGEAPCLEPSGAAGFAVDEAEVIFWGYCPECRRDRADGTSITNEKEEARA